MNKIFKKILEIKLFVVITCCCLPVAAVCDEIFTNYHSDVEFRHYQHIDGQGIACKDCHTKLKNGLYKMLGHDVCVSCHMESIKVYEISKDTCGMCHLKLEKDGDEYKISIRMGEKPRNIFFHTEALDNICYICHGDMLEEIVDRGSIRTEAGRFRIRETAHKFYFASKCDKCHEGISPEIAPDNHTNAWSEKHKEVAPVFNCKICHAKSYCQSCHIDVY